MSETPSAALLQWALGHGLQAASRVYEREPDGRLVYRGQRPGPEWEGHGTTRRLLLTLIARKLVRLVVHKQRWRLRGTNTTCHSRPPDDCASVWFCSLVVALSLWGWLRSGEGVHTYEPVLDALAERPSRRTVQRWMARALPLAGATAQAVRHALIDRSEPRPWESFLGGGLSPPEARRRWADPAAVHRLRLGLDLAIKGACALTTPVSLLMAEARRRQPDPDQPWLI